LHSVVNCFSKWADWRFLCHSVWWRYDRCRLWQWVFLISIYSCCKF